MNKHDFIYTPGALKEYLTEKGVDTQQIDLFDVPQEHDFYLMIPKYYVDLIDWRDVHDPLRKMVLTSNLEKEIHEYEVVDPIGDTSHSPVPGIVHRYPDRCLLMLTSACAVHCRFCFRKNLLTSSTAHYEQSMQYIENHPEIWEVILSGGDPFTFTDVFMETVIERLRSIKHVKLIRFHTRTPAVYPQRVTDNFINILKKAAQTIVVLHINHPREITTQFIASIRKLQSAHVLLLSQTVLMKDINNSTQTLVELFKGLVELGIKPYYLHHLDPAAGTHHFRVDVEEGKKLMVSLRGHISGHCIPEYVIDTPGGHGKIPVFWFHHDGKGTYHANSFEGKQILYTDNIKG